MVVLLCWFVLGFEFFEFLKELCIIILVLIFCFRLVCLIFVFFIFKLLCLCGMWICLFFKVVFLEGYELFFDIFLVWIFFFIVIFKLEFCFDIKLLLWMSIWLLMKERNFILLKLFKGCFILLWLSFRGGGGEIILIFEKDWMLLVMEGGVGMI